MLNDAYKLRTGLKTKIDCQLKRHGSNLTQLTEQLREYHGADAPQHETDEI